MANRFPWLDPVADAVLRVLDERRPPLVVAVDGRSGSGKSTLAAALADRLRATVVPTDDFFAAEITNSGWEARTAAERARDAIDWRRMRQHALDPLLAGRPAVWHPFDFAAGPRADGSYPVSPQAVSQEPAPVIILDGTYSAGPELDDAVHLAILIQVPTAERRARLAAREEPAFLAAWHERWDAAEDYYFSKVRTPSEFDLVLAL